MQACDRCHKRKTKCDKVHPRCGPCVKGRASCAYSDKSKEQVYRKEFVELLERKNRRLEATNHALTEQLASFRETQQQATSNTPSVARGPVGAHDDLRTNNDVANEVSFLSTFAGGDRQFLGSASGLLFANIVRASVVNLTGRDADGSVSSPYIGPGLGGPTQGKPEWSIDDSNLPTLALAGPLIEAYLAHDHLCYPCLHPDFVRQLLRSIYHDPAYYRRNAFEAFIFDMLLAIGTSQIHKFNWQALPDAETHHMRAMMRLNTVMSGGGLPALQAMLLLCQFRLSSSTKDTSGSLWHLVGVAARMSLELGLHRESVYRIKNSGQRSQDRAISTSEFEQQEIRRRCFWCVFTLDRIVSITLGRPLAICWEDIDVELPQADIGDAISPAATGGSDSQDMPYNTPNSRTAVFVHIVRYRALCGKFLSMLHRSSRRIDQPEAELRKIRGDLALELEAWKADTGSLHLPEMDLSSPIAEARSSFRSRAWYELLYHNAILLLYRPTPNLSSSDLSSDIQRIFTSAKQSIKLYSYLFRSRKINFSWMVLHAVFMAGLTYVYAVSRHIREKRKSDSSSTPSPATLLENPTIVEIVNDCRACSQVLVAVSERCNAQKNCHEVFDRLSDAVLADAVELISGNSSKPIHNAEAVRPPIHNTDAYDGSISYATPTSFALGNHINNALDVSVSAHRSEETRQRAQQQANFVDDGFDQSYLESAGVIPPLATDNALRDCFPDLEQLYDAQWGDDAILHLSMDWLGDINPNARFT